MWALSYNGMNSQLELVEPISKIQIPDKSPTRDHHQQISECKRMNRVNPFHFHLELISRGILNRSSLASSSLRELNSSRMTRSEVALTLSVIRKNNLLHSRRVSRNSSHCNLKEVTSSPSDHLPPRSSSTKGLSVMGISHPTLTSRHPREKLRNLKTRPQPGKVASPLSRCQASKRKISSRSRPLTRKTMRSVSDRSATSRTTCSRYTLFPYSL
jgi:hypothetical protein